VLISQRYGASNDERKTLGGEVDPGDTAETEEYRTGKAPT